jgi:hypothetical protein
MPAPSGSDRVDVVVNTSTTAGFEPNINVAAVKNLSGQTVPGTLNGGSTVVLGVKDETIPEPITYTNIPAGFNAPSAEVVYAFDTVGGDFELSSSATSQYPSVPAAAAQNGDYYQFAATAYGSLTGAAGQQVTQSVGVNKTVSAAGPVSIELPDAWLYTGPTPAALPVFNLSYSGFPTANAAFNEVGILWTTSERGAYYVQMMVSGSYLNGNQSLAVPDLSSLSGFVEPPASGESVNWYVSLSTGGYFPELPTPSNENISFVGNQSTYVVP